MEEELRRVAAAAAMKEEEEKEEPRRRRTEGVEMAYGSIKDQEFSWEEKLVAPLIATPNGEVRK